MTRVAPPEVKGWCPGALRPMRSGDGLVVRVRPPCGRLTQDQAAGIAALALAHGNGLVDLTSRANLQLRGVDDAGWPALLEGLARLGLLDADPATEARRNVLVTPFADAGADAVAAALSAALAAAKGLALPGKFGFAVDVGGSLDAAAADIRLDRVPQGWTLRADGASGGRLVPAAEAAAEALGLARWFIAAGGVEDGRGRMAALIARGASPPGHNLRPSAPAMRRRPPPVPGLVPQGALVGAAFGVLEAGQLAALAGLGPLRPTPWRLLLVEGLRAMPAIPGLVTRPDDPCLGVAACTGEPGCPQGRGPVRALARALAPLVPGLHVSGCAKGCAHPGPARVTLVATGAGLYDLVRDGTAADSPALTGLHPDRLLRDAPSL